MSRDRLSRAVSLLPFLYCMTDVHAQTPDPRRALAAIREYALNYTKSLPDFVCIRVTQQSTGYKNLVRYKSGEISHPLVNVVEEELTFSGKRETYRTLKVDDQIPENLLKPVPEQVLRTISAGEFGWALERIFGQETGTQFQWSRPRKLQGRPVEVFSLTVPRVHGAKVYDRLAKQGLLVGYEGVIYADARSHAVLRLEIKISDFQPQSEFTGMELSFDYRVMKTAEREFVLPCRFILDLHSRIGPGPLSINYLSQESSVQADYKSYRLSAVQSGVTYSTTDSLPQSDVHSIVTFGDVGPPVP